MHVVNMLWSFSALVVVKIHVNIPFQPTFCGEILEVKWNDMVNFFATKDFTSLVLRCVQTITDGSWGTWGFTDGPLKIFKNPLDFSKLPFYFTYCTPKKYLYYALPSKIFWVRPCKRWWRWNFGGWNHFTLKLYYTTYIKMETTRLSLQSQSLKVLLYKGTRSFQKF